MLSKRVKKFILHNNFNILGIILNVGDREIISKGRFTLFIYGLITLRLK